MKLALRLAIVYGFALSLFGASCPPPEPPAPPEPVQPDADVDVMEPEEGTACERACDRMRKLACEAYDGSDSPSGATCEEVCEHTESSGVATFCPEHVAVAQDCKQLEKAFVACE